MSNGASASDRPKARDYLVDHHRKIYEAIQSGDAAMADDLILNYFAIGAAWNMKGSNPG